MKDHRSIALLLGSIISGENTDLLTRGCGRTLHAYVGASVEATQTDRADDDAAHDDSETDTPLHARPVRRRSLVTRQGIRVVFSKYIDNDKRKRKFGVKCCC